MTQDPATSLAMTRSEERLDVRTETVVYDRVRVRRRIVVEERTVVVQVRREELVVESAAVDRPGITAQGGSLGAGSAGDEPIVYVLHQEVPEIVMRTEAYERVTVTKQALTRDERVRADVSHEVIELEHDVTGAG